MSTNLKNRKRLHINEVSVDGWNLIDDADGHGEGFSVRLALFSIIHGRQPEVSELASIGQLEESPEWLDFFYLAPLLGPLDGLQALRALDYVEQDIDEAKDHLVRSIAQQYVLPELAELFGENAPIYGDALNLVDVFSSWRTGHAPAEKYGRASVEFLLKHRNDPMGETRNVELLLKALPIHGVDNAAYYGIKPSAYWRSFGNYLAQFSNEGVAIDDLRHELNERDPDDESTPDFGWYHQAFDNALESIGREKLLDHDEMIKAQILSALTLYPAA
jgi:hypothetical protein